MKGAALVLIGLSLVGCGQAGTGSGGTVQAAENHVSHASSRELPEMRWARKTIPVSVNRAWARHAGNAWSRKVGVKFAYGKRGGIVFGGYKQRSGKVGWAVTKFIGKEIISCTIYINPTYLSRKPIEKTFAHELGHCLGMNYHAKGNGLMSRFAKTGRISKSTIKYLRNKYGH